MNLANNAITADGLPAAVAKRWGFAPAGAGAGGDQGGDGGGAEAMDVTEVDATLEGNPILMADDEPAGSPAEVIVVE